MKGGEFCFGQFLIAEGAIDVEAARQALDLMDRENPRLAELATAEDLLSEFEAGRVTQTQRQLGKSFAEAAVSLGLLTEEQAETLARKAADASIDLGEALVQLGRLDAGAMTALRSAFAEVAEEVEPQNAVLPEDLTGVRLAELIIELIPRYMQRIAGIEVAIEALEVQPARADSLKANLTLKGTPGLTITLLTDYSVAARIAAGVAGFDADDFDRELIEDGLAEFLNLVAGNVTTLLRREGIEVDVEPPEPGLAGPRGSAFRVLSLRGEAVLQLNKGP